MPPFPGFYTAPGGGGGSAVSPTSGSASGTLFAESLQDGTFIANERISGGVGGAAVCFNQSGQLITAMASVSGRMPAIGVVTSNFVSGASVQAFLYGRLLQQAALNFSGWMNQPVYVGRSGQLSASGAPSLSGDVLQIMGVSVYGSGMFLNPGDPIQGTPATSGDIGSGAIMGASASGFMMIASGSIGGNDIGSGQVTRYLMASGNLVETWPCGQALSGVRAVTFGSGGDFVVPAERSSGLRLPAFGVTVSTAVSGGTVEVITRGRVFVSFSGGIASGFPGRYLYVGSGGLLINQSGFMGGASSGHGAGPTAAESGYSGSLVQRIAVWVSGGLYVNPEPVAVSGLISGLLSQY